jgi:hypothetical protein
MIIGIVFFGVAWIVAIAYFFAVRRPARLRGSRAGWQPPAVPPPGTSAPVPPPPVSGPMPPPVHCRNCGAKLAAGARFCHSCGTAVV